MAKEGLSSQEHETPREQLISPEVTAADITRTLPEIDGTKIILQRHERYQRAEDESGTPLGSLSPESAERAYHQTQTILTDMLSSIPSDERKDAAFLVVGSNTQFKGQGKRSMETAAEVLRATKDEIKKEGLNDSQIQNNRSQAKGVAPITKIQAPRFLDDSKDYASFLRNTYGDETPAFWKAFEEDTHADERKRFGAEGPDDMDQRFTRYLQALMQYAKKFHETNPGKRLVVWTVSHYDTISPFLKRHVTKTDPHQFVPIDYGAGISLEVDKEGNVVSTFHGKTYDVDLHT